MLQYRATLSQFISPPGHRRATGGVMCGSEFDSQTHELRRNTHPAEQRTHVCPRDQIDSRILGIQAKASRSSSRTSRLMSRVERLATADRAFVSWRRADPSALSIGAGRRHLHVCRRNGLPSPLAISPALASRSSLSTANRAQVRSSN
jgi:hypothetical protein